MAVQGHVTGFFHGGVTVADMDESLRFYREGLGLQQKFDRTSGAAYLHEVLRLNFSEIRTVYLHIPGRDNTFVELLEYRGIERLPASSRPCDYGSGHLCLYVDDVEAVFGRLISMGFLARSEHTVLITEGPNEGAKFVYMIDPDGYAVELMQPPRA